MKDLREVRDSNILLDTNVLIYYATDDFAERSDRILRLLLKNKNLLSVSEITGFELLNCDPTDKRLEQYQKFLNSVPNHPVTRDILINAAALSRESKRLCKEPKRGFPIPDLILGGTVLYYLNDPVYILTADRHDFSEPLWETVANLQVLKKDKEDIDAHLYLLSVNRKVLSEQYRNK